MNALGNRWSSVYDAAGRTVGNVDPLNRRSTSVYDNDSNLTNLHNLKSDNTVISSFDYRYNDINNRTAVGEANGDRVTWTYDTSSNLTSERRSAANAYRNTFQYDPVGNRLVLNEDGTRPTYTFDADGKQQFVQKPNAERTTNHHPLLDVVRRWSLSQRRQQTGIGDCGCSIPQSIPKSLRRVFKLFRWSSSEWLFTSTFRSPANRPFSGIDF